MTVDGETTAPLENDAEARPTEVRVPDSPATGAADGFETTVLGRSNVMTSESGSFMVGRSQMKVGLYMIDSPAPGP